MTPLHEALEQLLYEDESCTLDFKRNQYPFDGASNHDKSEILKDILAFTNAWRRSDAYILIGVDDVQGGRSRVIGVTHHLDDVKLQQFVNAKTQRALHFSYQGAELDGLDVGVIHIPPQERPVYLTKDFGKLKKNTVYIRRSSSTDIASPDEIKRMHEAVADVRAAIPLLEVHFFDPKNLVDLGKSVEIETVNLSLPSECEIPDYGCMRFPVGRGTHLTIPWAGKNQGYYRDVAVFLKKTMETWRLEFAVSNAGNVVADDVRLEITVKDPTEELILRDVTAMPEEPSSDLVPTRVPKALLNPDIRVQRSPHSWIVSAQLGKIQPKASAETNSGLFVGARIPREIGLAVKVFADNLPSPRPCDLVVKVEPKTLEVPVEKLIELANKECPDNSDERDAQ